jgi:aminopeptidase YwaD
VAESIEDLSRPGLRDAVIVLTGALAAEPLTPKKFPFYGSDAHSRIISALEDAEPAAVIAVTGKFPALCGALDPFPLIEDGDFSIPTGNVRPGDAGPLLAAAGRLANVEIRSERRRARARNVIASTGPRSPRVTLIAHIDTKPGTPGAVDNAAGVVALLLAADALSPARGADLPIGLEVLLVNGEDHYGAPGELDWLASNEGRLDEVVLALNIDGAGYREGRSAYSTYNVGPGLQAHIDRTFSEKPSLIAGPEFYQSDHAIFAMQGRPAMAITTELVNEMLDQLFHAPTDTPHQVDVDLLLDISDAITELITTWPN